jgi:hypothetical protein
MEREIWTQDSPSIYTVRTGECGQSMLTWGKNSAEPECYCHGITADAERARLVNEHVRLDGKACAS